MMTSMIVSSVVLVVISALSIRDYVEYKTESSLLLGIVTGTIALLQVLICLSNMYQK